MNNSFDFNSAKGRLLLAILVILFIFCFARTIKAINYDATDFTHVIELDGEYIIVSAYRSPSTEEWEKAINRHNKSNLDEIEENSSQSNQ